MEHEKVKIHIDTVFLSLYANISHNALVSAVPFVDEVNHLLKQYGLQQDVLASDTEEISITLDVLDVEHVFLLKIKPLSNYSGYKKTEGSMKKLYQNIIIDDDGLSVFMNIHDISYLDIVSAFNITGVSDV